MKRLILGLSILLISMFIIACGNTTNDGIESPENDVTIPDNNLNEDNEVPNSSTPDNDNTDDRTNTSADDEATNEDDKTADSSNSDLVSDQAANQEDMKKMMKTLDFYEIELDISYGHDKEYEMEIEHHSNGDIQAEIEDEINQVNIKDDLDAFNHLFPTVNKLKISKDMEKQAVINHVLDVFDLKNDYEKFDVEFTFEDDSKLSFEDKR